MTMQD